MSRYNGKRKPRPKPVHVTHEVLTFVDPVTGDPYANGLKTVAGPYRDPVFNSIRKMPRKSRGRVKKAIRAQRANAA